MAFNRKAYMKNVHAQAKNEKQLYKELTGKDATYSEFLKGQSPLDMEVVIYDVSYQMTYMSTSNNFSIQSPQTFRVFALNTDNSTNAIVSNTIEAVKNMKASSGAGLNAGLQKTIDDKLDVKLNKVPTPRGFEKSEDVKLTSNIIGKIKQGNGFFVETIDSGAVIEGGKKNKSNKVNMKVDLTNYIE